MRAIGYAIAVSAVAVLGVAMIARGPASAPSVPGSPLAPSVSEAIVPAAMVVDHARSEALLSALNDARRAAGLTPLDWDDDLADAAQTHAEDMERRDYFGHFSANGGDLRARLSVTTVDAYPLLRQTLWTGRTRADRPDAAVANEVVRAWMNDVSQLSAVLDPTATHAGAAMVRRADDGRAVLVLGGHGQRF